MIEPVGVKIIVKGAFFVKNRRYDAVYTLLFVFILPFFLIMLPGCASKKRVMPPLATVEGEKRHFSQGRIIDLKTGKAISFPRLVEQLGSVDVIFVGEVHDNPEHHLIQVQLLQALTGRYPPLAVAMEFFDRTRQPALDRFMAGDLDETDFLAAVDWENSWRFPYHLYRPLLWVTKEKGSALLGINAPNPLVKKVARSGLTSLSPEERQQVAREIDLKNKDHREYLETVFEQHTAEMAAHHGLNNFEFFYQAQCVWDETMAETIAHYLETHGGKMVVFTGNGHIVNRFGVPERVLRRVDLRLATILLYPLTERTTINKRLADYVWLTGDAKTARTMKRPAKMPPLKESIQGKMSK